MTGKIFIALNKLEADTHWSNGRIEEALAIYKSLISSSPNMTLSAKVSIESRIEVLTSELKTPASKDSDRTLDRAIQKLQNVIDSDDSAVNLRRSAKKYYRLGRYVDALENLKLLIRKNAADEFCVTAVAGCIMHLHPIKDLPVAIDLFLTEAFRSADKASSFKLMLAKKMAKKGYAKHAKVLARHQNRFTSVGQYPHLMK